MMSRTVDEVIADLNAFRALDDERADIERLYAITDGLGELASANKALPALFAVLERHLDCELGIPGPVVHAIEELGGHIPQLLASIDRRPVHLSVWMVNRLLNSELESSTRDQLMSVLQAVAYNLEASDEVRESARGFIEYQTG